MPKEDIKKILENVSSGNYSEHDLNVSRLWLHQLNSGSKTSFTEEQLQEISTEMWQRIMDGTESGQKVSRVKYLRIIFRVAAILSIIFTCAYFIHDRFGSKGRLTAYVQTRKPGGTSAVLVLSNGKTIGLDPSRTSKLAGDVGVDIDLDRNGFLSYHKASGAGAPSEPVMNKLITPRGGQFVATLPDGTKVHLNAASSITYPIFFHKGRPRIVELSGEAYFEVSHDPHAVFIVKTVSQQVSVLGTHFDISAYPQDSFTQTTLLQGAVMIDNLSSQQSSKLLPGEQSIVQGKTLTIGQVDPENFVAWKDGLFVFDKAPLHSVMACLSRWYDFDYMPLDKSIANMPFSGSIARFTSLKQVLDKLEKVGGINFGIQQNKITVMDMRSDISTNKP